MRNKCLLGLGLVFVISLTSMVAFAFSFTGTPADEVDETEIIVSAVVSEEAYAMPTTEPITTTGQEMVKNEQSKIGSMDWDSDDAYKLAKIAMAEAESEDTEGKALVMLVVLNRVWDDEFPDTIEEVIFQKGQFSPIGNGRYDEVEPDEDCYRALQLMEWRNNKIIQCRGFKNCGMPADVQAFVKVFEKKMNEAIQGDNKKNAKRKAG